MWQVSPHGRDSHAGVEGSVLHGMCLLMGGTVMLEWRVQCYMAGVSSWEGQSCWSGGFSTTWQVSPHGRDSHAGVEGSVLHGRCLLMGGTVMLEWRVQCYMAGVSSWEGQSC